MLTPTDNGNGYKIVGLHKGPKRRNRYVHRLVAEAFIPNPDGLKEINHLDYNRGNNAVENLEWSSRKENIRWSLEHMRRPKSGVRLTNIGMRYISKRGNKYRVSIHVKHLGYRIDKRFETLEEAMR